MQRTEGTDMRKKESPLVELRKMTKKKERNTMRTTATKGQEWKIKKG